MPTEYLFAPKPFDDRTGERVSRLLREGGEMPLWCGSGNVETYRVIWLPANRPAVVARVQESPGGWSGVGIVFVDPRTSQDARNRPWQVQEKTAKLVAETRLVNLSNVTTASPQFWTFPAWRHSPDTMDGAAWFIEGRKSGIYRIVTRYNFDDPPFENIARDILIAAALKVPEEMERRKQ